MGINCLSFIVSCPKVRASLQSHLFVFVLFESINDRDYLMQRNGRRSVTLVSLLEEYMYTIIRRAVTRKATFKKW